MKVVGFDIKRKVYAVFIEGVREIENAEFKEYGDVGELLRAVGEDYLLVTGVDTKEFIVQYEVLPDTMENKIQEILDIKFKGRERLRKGFYIFERKDDKISALLFGVPENLVVRLEKILEKRRFIIDSALFSFFNILEFTNCLEDGAFIHALNGFYHFLRIKDKKPLLMKTFEGEFEEPVEWIKNGVKEIEKSEVEKVGVAGELCSKYPHLCLSELNSIFGFENKEKYIIAAGYAVRGFYDKG